MKKVANIKLLIRSHYHACQAEDWDEAAEIILESYDFLRYNNHPESIKSLCESLLPVDWQDGKQLISSTSKHIDILHRLGITYYDLGEFVKSNQYLDCCFNFAKQTGYRIIEADTLSYIALNHQHLENYEITIKCLEDCLAITKDIQQPKLECRALQFLAKTHEYLGNYQDSISYYLKAQELARQHEFLEGKLTVGNLGCIYVRIKKYELAINCINQYMSTYEEFFQFDSQLYVLKDISNFRSNIRDSSEMVDLFQQQTEIYIDLADRNNQTDNVNVLITVYDALEEWQKFMGVFEKCLNIIGETSSFQSQVNCLYQSGIVYRKILDVSRGLENLSSDNREVMLIVELVKVFFKAKMMFTKTIKYNLMEAEQICVNLQLSFLTEVRKLQADLI